MFQGGSCLEPSGSCLPQLVQSRRQSHKCWTAQRLRCPAWHWPHVPPHVSSRWSFLVVAQYSLQLLCADLIKHPCSAGCSDRWCECSTVFDTSLTCFSYGLFQIMELPATCEKMAQTIKTLPPLAVYFYFYHFCSFIKSTTGPCSLNISLIWLLLNVNLCFLEISLLSV